MRTYAILHSIVFLGSVIAIGVAAAARALPYTTPRDAGVVIGEVARHFENHYDDRFPVRTFGTNLWAAAQYLLFREGRPGVVIGRHDWLYTDEEFRGWPQAQAEIDARLALIESAHRRLARQGTALVVALVPAKARVYPEHRGERAPARIHERLYRRLRAALLTRGITAPDLLTAMQHCKATAAVFLRTDTHWTPFGAECAAAEIARSVAPLRAPDAPLQRFTTEFGEPRAHAGDLTRFLPLSPHFDALLPPADMLTPSTTFAAQPTDLLAETPVPGTVLVGTSYSADPSWNFDGALKTALREDVLNLAAVGHGPFAPMRDYLDSATASQVRIVVWEMPERYLPMPEAFAAATTPKTSSGERT